jgi:hypothetical protein
MADLQRQPRSPGSKPPYRPDLRPMVVLIGMLVVILVGWIILSPVILPPP